jgi:hypothetical protein
MNVTPFSGYKVVDGTYYYEQTPDAVVQILESSRQSRSRLAISYDGETRPACGYVGRTTGNVKAPILLYNARSMGGMIILTDMITQIRETRTNRVLYTRM